MSRRFGDLARERTRAKGRSWAWIGLAGAGLWLLVLAALFWYPFDFQWDRASAMERLASLRRAPFQTYWVDSEYRALTEVLHKTLFFAPLGAALAVTVSSIQRRRARALATVAAFLLIAAVAVGIELGQVFLPNKVPDSTDAMLMIGGGALGFLAVLALRRRLLPPEAGAPATAGGTSE